MTSTRIDRVREAQARRNTARKEKVLAAATACARADGYQWITRSIVADAAGVCGATVSNAFGGMLELKREVLRQAVASRDLALVAQGLTDRHPIVMDAPEELRAAAAASMLSS